MKFTYRLKKSCRPLKFLRSGTSLVAVLCTYIGKFRTTLFNLLVLIKIPSKFYQKGLPQ